MYYVHPNANSITVVGTMPSDGPSGWNSTDVMYAPGKILRCGGGSTTLPETQSAHAQGKNAAAVIDINPATPSYKKMASMPNFLIWANATVLADGNVVVTGGSAVDNQLTGMNTTALLWKAGTGGWTQGAQSAAGIARLYHSVALLLPDGSVLSGGGGAPGPQTNLNVEIYYPPYLFTNSGTFAPRPTITSSPGTLTYGQRFAVGVSSARENPAGYAYQNGLGDPQLQFRAALYGADVHFQCWWPVGASAVARGLGAARQLPAVCDRQTGRAVRRRDRSDRLTGDPAQQVPGITRSFVESTARAVGRRDRGGVGWAERD
jgi:hypothetical protein